MNGSSLEAVLRTAIEKEEQARSFYATWAERVTDPGAAALLKELSAEEVTHRQRLEAGLPLARTGLVGLVKLLGARLAN